MRHGNQTGMMLGFIRENGICRKGDIVSFVMEMNNSQNQWERRASYSAVNQLIDNAKKIRI